MDGVAIIQKFKSLADRGDFGGASEFLSSLTCSGELREKRIIGHLSTQLLLYEGRFSEALPRLELLIHDFGEHLGIWCDIASCHYFLGNHNTWSGLIGRIAEKFQVVRHELSLETEFRTSVALGKLFEESGHLAVALRIYEEQLGRISEAEHSREYYSCLAQLLRVRAIAGDRAGLGSAYRRLISSASAHPSIFTDIELQHSLAVAEAHLVGIEHAITRLERLRSSPLATLRDRQLIFFDLLEACLVLGIDPHPLKSFAPAERSSMDVYEALLFQIGIEGKSEIEAERWTRLPGLIPPASFIRLLAVMLSVGDDTAFRRELWARQRLLLDALDPASKALWFARPCLHREFKRITIVCEENARALRYEGERKCLRRKKTLFAFLRSFQGTNRLEMVPLVRSVWNASYNPSYYHRVRVIAQRLNVILYDLTGLSNPLRVSNDSVSLADGIVVEID